LPVLLRVDHASPYYHEEQKGTIFYAESWALTHFLVLNDEINKTDHVQEYVRLMMQHQDPVAAAQQAFGDLNKLQRALDSYVQRSVFQLYRVKTSAVTEEISSMQAVSVSIPEAEAVRADLLASVGRTKDAESLLNTVLRDDPTNALAHETMGTIRFREGDISATKNGTEKLFDWIPTAIWSATTTRLCRCTPTIKVRVRRLNPAC